MLQSDSVDKIITRYFGTVASEAFSYKGKVYEPRVLKVSPLLLRDYTCPPMCGGCCFKFSLDYLPSEPRPDGLVKRRVEVNERMVEIWSDWQESNTTTRCQHLARDTGRCGIYQVRPMSCDFELIRSLQSVDGESPNVLTQKLFGRGWSYQRVDGGKGALCEMTPITDHSIEEVIRKLTRLEEWAHHFHVKTWIPNLIDIVRKGHLRKAVAFDPIQKVGFGL